MVSALVLLELPRISVVVLQVVTSNCLLEAVDDGTALFAINPQGRVSPFDPAAIVFCHSTS